GAAAVPAKAGTHFSAAQSRDSWIRAFAENPVSTVAPMYGSGISRPPSSSTDEEQRGLLEIALDALDEGRRLPAIDDPVIKRGGQVHHLADDDLTLPHDRPLGDAVDADDCDFGVVDDRRRGEPAQWAEARDRDRRAGEFFAARFTRARCLS